MRWDSARAFGFIRSPDTPADIFFHVRDFRGTGIPREGMSVTFEAIHVGGKGPRAMAVQAAMGLPAPASHAAKRAGAPAPAHGRSRAGFQIPQHRAVRLWPSVPALLLMLVWAVLLGWESRAGRLPAMALPIALLLNLATFFMYWTDKHAAQTGRWRTPENTLHLLALLGGWPGAGWAQALLRHKSSKSSFLLAYWVTVALHCTVLAGLAFSPQLQKLITS
ncbi:MAG: hypothetical protein JWR74_559 [Polaromonas sp.]|nr:hypothetical protein [Polaromonas sp.]